MFHDIRAARFRGPRGPSAPVTEDDRDAEAKRFRKEKGIDNGIYMLDIGGDGTPDIEAYSGEFFDED